MWDNVWEKIFQESEWGKYPAESLIRFIANNFYHKRNGGIKILEVGCGPGANIWYLSREGFEVYGIDGSSTAIQQAKKRLKNNGLTADLQVGDVVALPYNDQVFDAIIDIQCLTCNNMEDTRIILKEVKRCLKPQGLFYSVTMESYTGECGERGFLRYTDKQGVIKLYGESLNLQSVDKHEYTCNDRSLTIANWVIIAQKEALN